MGACLPVSRCLGFSGAFNSPSLATTRVHASSVFAIRCSCVCKLALPKTFLRGLFYSTSLQGAPSVRALCLNTNLYYKKMRRAAKSQQPEKGALEALEGQTASSERGFSLQEELMDEADPGNK